MVPYWVVQLAGAICAALFLQLMFGYVRTGGNYPITTPGGTWKSLVMEAILTAILVSIILNTAIGHRSIGPNAAIAVGSTVALLGLFASPISGASMNPARSLGPDIVGNDYTGWWVMSSARDRRRDRSHDHRTCARAARPGRAPSRPGRRPSDGRHRRPAAARDEGPARRDGVISRRCREASTTDREHGCGRDRHRPIHPHAERRRRQLS
jgi:hypothetical protein